MRTIIASIELLGPLRRSPRDATHRANAGQVRSPHRNTSFWHAYQLVEVPLPERGGSGVSARGRFKQREGFTTQGWLRARMMPLPHGSWGWIRRSSC